MFNITIQRMADYQTKQRDFDDMGEAYDKFEEAIAKADKVIHDDVFTDLQPLRRSARLQSKSGNVYIVNLYKF